MSKNTAPAVEMVDVRAWELPELPPNCFYRYNVTAKPGRPNITVSVLLVWEPVVGVSFLLAHEGEAATSPKTHHVTGAWIRAAARLSGRVSRETLEERVALAKWELDAKLPHIRA